MDFSYIYLSKHRKKGNIREGIKQKIEKGGALSLLICATFYYGKK